MKEAVAHVQVLVDHHPRRRPVRHAQFGDARTDHRAQHRVEAVQRPVLGQRVGDHGVDLVLLLRGRADDAGEQRRVGVGDAAVLEPVAAGPLAEPVAHELVDHRLGRELRLLGLEQRLHCGDPGGGARAGLGRPAHDWVSQRSAAT